MILNETDLLPAEKHGVRGQVAGQDAIVGEVVEVDGGEIEVLATTPSTGSAFGADETRIRFD